MDFQERVVQEQHELSEKSLKLARFLFSPQSEGISEEEKGLMQKQLHIMLDYSLVLLARITSFKHIVVDTSSGAKISSRK